MKSVDIIITWVVGSPEFIYMLTSCGITWLVLYFMVGYTNDKQRTAATGIVGIVTGILWIIIFPACMQQLDHMVLAFLASVGFYTFVVKQLMKFAGMDYNQFPGILKYNSTRRCQKRAKEKAAIKNV